MNIPAKFLDEFLCSCSNVAWEVDSINALEDNVVGFHGICASEWRSSGQEFEHQDSERPIVSRNVMALVEDNFWSHVLWGSTESPGLSSNLKHCKNLFKYFGISLQTCGVVVKVFAKLCISYTTTHTDVSCSDVLCFSIDWSLLPVFS